MGEKRVPMFRCGGAIGMLCPMHYFSTQRQPPSGEHNSSYAEFHKIIHPDRDLSDLA